MKPYLSGFKKLKGLKSLKKRFLPAQELRSEIIAMTEKAEPDMIVLFRELIKSL
ncbi:hypothetical protein [Gelidibacter sp.]|uniref:hypothetical protein n=1 Tax=Gelidibacter sp. TaxID=2018083 RepID=UPI002CEA095A|nr:hypothetical protein [Gelidibacter sp.]HUH27614.1 hypothetical protein [Gelidibacter sp.]